MAWRSLHNESKRNSGKSVVKCFLNRFERSAVRVSGSFVGNREVRGLKLGESGQGLSNSRSLTSDSVTGTAPLLQQCIGTAAPVLPDIISTETLQIENGEVLYSGMSSREF